MAHRAMNRGRTQQLSGGRLRLAVSIALVLLVAFLVFEPAALAGALGQAHGNCPVHGGCAASTAHAPSPTLEALDGPVGDPAAARLLSQTHAIFVPPRA